MRFETEANLKAQLNNLQSDYFTCLCNYIKKFSLDANLLEISKQPYLDIDNNQAVPSLDESKLVYGVIVGCDKNKRNQIVDEIVERLETLNTDTSQKYADMMLLAITYKKLTLVLKSSIAVPALRNHLDSKNRTLFEMYDRIKKYEVVLN